MNKRTKMITFGAMLAALCYVITFFSSQMPPVVLFLKYDLGHVLALDQINPAASGCIIGRDLLAADHIHRRAVHMGQQFLQLLIVRLFPAAAAAHIAVHQIIVRHIDLITAVAAAMPCDRTIAAPLF